MNGIHSLVKETPESFLTFSARKRTITYELGSRPLLDAKSVRSLTLDLPASRTVKYACCLSPPMCGIFL